MFNSCALSIAINQPIPPGGESMCINEAMFTQKQFTSVTLCYHKSFKSQVWSLERCQWLGPLAAALLRDMGEVPHTHMVVTFMII